MKKIAIHNNKRNIIAALSALIHGLEEGKVIGFEIAWEKDSDHGGLNVKFNEPQQKNVEEFNSYMVPS